MFWGLPVTLIVCFHAARAESLRGFGVAPPVICMAWLLYGVWQCTSFQKQERIWRHALDRTLLVASIDLGLSPFLYWWNRFPENLFFLCSAALLAIVALLFLVSLNLLLRRLGAMLPDEGLRVEIRQFTSINLGLLGALAGLSSLAILLWNSDRFLNLWWLHVVLEQDSLFMLVPLLLLPLAMTMALLWKTKEVILESVFEAKA